MIIQGTNKPLTLTFTGDMSTASKIEVGLYAITGVTSTTELKHWSKSDMTVSGTTVQCPQTEAESMAYTPGKCLILVKWLDSDSLTEFAKKIFDTIVLWDDTTIM